MRDYQTKQNAGGVADSINNERFGAGEFNSIAVELENAVSSSDQTLAPSDGTGEVSTQLAKAMSIYGAGGALYHIDTGAADAYVLNPVSPKESPPAYFDGFTVLFSPDNSNTGPATINVASIGLKDLVDNLGNALIGGEIIADKYVIARYNSSTDDFEIIFSNSESELPLPASGEAFESLQVNADGNSYELAGPLTAYKNKIINGNFELWDEATSQTSDGYGSDNNWLNEHSGSTKTASQQTHTLGQTDVPGNPEFFSRTVVTTGSGASDYVRKAQHIEYVRTLSGGNADLQFYAKADAAKDIAIEFVQNFGTTGSPSAEVDQIGVETISLTSSWQFFTLTVALPSVSGKTLGDDLNDYLEVRFWFDAGSNFDANTNTLGNQSGTFDLDRIQLEVGSSATIFEDRSIEQERTLDQRFYEFFADGNLNMPQPTSTGATSTNRNLGVIFKTVKRATPSISSTGNATLTNDNISTTGFRLARTEGDTTTARFCTDWTASARL